MTPDPAFPGLRPALPGLPRWEHPITGVSRSLRGAPVIEVAIEIRETMLILHVYPVGDLVDHDTEGGPCICCPEQIDLPDKQIVIHHAADGRE